MNSVWREQMRMCHLGLPRRSFGQRRSDSLACRNREMVERELDSLPLT